MIPFDVVLLRVIIWFTRILGEWETHCFNGFKSSTMKFIMAPSSAIQNPILLDGVYIQFIKYQILAKTMLTKRSMRTLQIPLALQFLIPHGCNPSRDSFYSDLGSQEGVDMTFKPWVEH